MYDALFRQLGVIRAQTFADLLDIPGALATGRRAAGRRVAILTSTGGAGTLVADACGLAGFETPPPDAATAARLAALQEGDHAALDRNPIDVTLAGLQPDLFRSAIDALLESPSYDALVIIVGSSALAQPDLVADAVVECQARSDKPVLAYVSPHAPEIVRLLNQRGVPAFAAPEACATVLEALQRRPAPDVADTAGGRAGGGAAGPSPGLAERGREQGAVRPLRRSCDARERRGGCGGRRGRRPRRSAAAWCSRSCRARSPTRATSAA